jgi:prevent-host-death family protein
METLPSAKAREQFAELIDRAAYGKERIAVAKHRKQLVAIVPIEDLKLLEYLEERIDLNEARKALEASKNEATIELDDLTRALGFEPSQFRRRGI